MWIIKILGKILLFNIKYCALIKKIKINSLRSIRQLKMKMYENEVRIKHGEIICSSSELDLGVTLKGGQSFRWISYNIMNDIL